MGRTYLLSRCRKCILDDAHELPKDATERIRDPDEEEQASIPYLEEAANVVVAALPKTSGGDPKQPFGPSFFLPVVPGCALVSPAAVRRIFGQPKSGAKLPWTRVEQWLVNKAYWALGTGHDRGALQLPVFWAPRARIFVKSLVWNLASGKPLKMHGSELRAPRDAPYRLIMFLSEQGEIGVWQQCLDETFAKVSSWPVSAWHEARMRRDADGRSWLVENYEQHSESPLVMAI